MTKYVVKMDYCTMAFTAGTCSLQVLSNCLAGDTDLHWMKIYNSEKSPYHSPLGLYYNDACGSFQNPHVARISGVGCEHFRTTLPILYDRLQTGGEQAHITRLDFCFDILMTKSAWRSFLAQCFAYQLETMDSRSRKRYVVHADGDSSTVYIGARSSDRYFRIYNKSLEDPQFQYRDPLSGVSIEVPEGSYIIRYEVELKRKTRTSKGVDVTLDLKPYFESYFADGKLLCDELRRIWLSFGNDIVLPSEFAESEFVTDIVNYGISCDGGTISPPRDVLYANISARYHDYPHEFESKLSYAADKYGKYIPYILQNKELFRRCIARAYSEYGWDIPIYIEIGARNKLDDQLEPDELFECSVPEYENIDIFKERGLSDARCTPW